MLPDSHRTHELWWNGPAWLRSLEDTWPISWFDKTIEKELPDVKTDPLKVVVIVEKSTLLTRLFHGRNC